MKKNPATDGSDSYEAHITENTGDYKVAENKTLNFIAKILSVVVAFFIWFYAMSTETSTYTQTFNAVPVNIENVEKTGFSIITGYNNTVDITVQGKKSEIDKLSASGIEAWVDVSNVKSSGRYSFDINFSLPGGLRVAEQSANSISVYLDRTVTVTVPVKAEVVDYYAEGSYECGEPIVYTNEISVTGPAAVVETIKYAKAELNVGHLTDSIEGTSPLILVDQNDKQITNPYIEMDISTTSYRVPVYVYKTVPLEVSYKYGYFNSSNVLVTIEPASVTIKGEPSEINLISNKIIKILDEKEYGDDATFTQTISFPVSVVNVDNVTEVTVSIKHVGTALKEIQITDFAVNNPNNLNYELIDSSVIITVRGPLSYLTYLSAASIKATVNLTNVTLTAGEGNEMIAAPLIIKLDGTYNKYVYEIGKYAAGVKIIK